MNSQRFRMRSTLGRILAALTIASLPADREGFAQTFPKPPKGWTACSLLYGRSSSMGLAVNNATPEAICQELLDPEMIRFAATARRLSDKDLSTVTVGPGLGQGELSLWQIGRSSRAAFDILGGVLGNYAHARNHGHTKQFAMAAMTNAISSPVDPDLQMLVTNRMLPPSWLVRTGTGTRTNRASERPSGPGRTISFPNGTWHTNVVPVRVWNTDEVCRWSSFQLVDGEVAWDYELSVRGDGTLDSVYEWRHDAKDCDPQYRESMAEVDAEIQAELKRSGMDGKPGATHTAWRLKREKLKARGIAWRSPAELDPHSRFD
jgi:hypothetical protein